MTQENILSDTDDHSKSSIPETHGEDITEKDIVSDLIENTEEPLKSALSDVVDKSVIETPHASLIKANIKETVEDINKGQSLNLLGELSANESKPQIAPISVTQTVHQVVTNSEHQIVIKTDSSNAGAPNFPRLPPDGHEFPEHVNFEQKRQIPDLPPPFTFSAAMDAQKDVSAIPGLSSERFGDRPVVGLHKDKVEVRPGAPGIPGQKTFYPAVPRAAPKKTSRQEKQANQPMVASQTAKANENPVDLLNRDTLDGTYSTEGIKGNVPDLVPVMDSLQSEKRHNSSNEVSPDKAEVFLPDGSVTVAQGAPQASHSLLTSDSVFEDGTSGVTNNRSRCSSVSSDSGSVTSESKKSYAPPLQSTRTESLVDTLEKKRRESMGAKLKGLQIPSRRLSSNSSVTGLPTLAKAPAVGDKKPSALAMRGFKPPTLKKIDTNPRSNVAKLRLRMEAQAQNEIVETSAEKIQRSMVEGGLADDSTLFKRPPPVLPKPQFHPTPSPRSESMSSLDASETAELSNPSPEPPSHEAEPQTSEPSQELLLHVDEPKQLSDEMGLHQDVSQERQTPAEPQEEPDLSAKLPSPRATLIDFQTSNAEQPQLQLEDTMTPVPVEEELLIVQTTETLQSEPPSVSSDSSLSDNLTSSLSIDSEPVQQHQHTRSEPQPQPKYSLQFSKPLRQGPKPFMSATRTTESTGDTNIEHDLLGETTTREYTKTRRSHSPVIDEVTENTTGDTPNDVLLSVNEQLPEQERSMSEEIDTEQVHEGEVDSDSMRVTSETVLSEGSTIQDGESAFMEDSDASTVIEVAPPVPACAPPPVPAALHSDDEADLAEDNDEAPAAPLLPPTLPPNAVPDETSPQPEVSSEHTEEYIMEKAEILTLQQHDNTSSETSTHAAADVPSLETTPLVNQDGGQELQAAVNSYLESSEPPANLTPTSQNAVHEDVEASSSEQDMLSEQGQARLSEQSPEQLISTMSTGQVTVSEQVITTEQISDSEQVTITSEQVTCSTNINGSVDQEATAAAISQPPVPAPRRSLSKSNSTDQDKGTYYNMIFPHS